MLWDVIMLTVGFERQASSSSFTLRCKANTCHWRRLLPELQHKTPLARERETRIEPPEIKAEVLDGAPSSGHSRHHLLALTR